MAIPSLRPDLPSPTPQGGDLEKGKKRGRPGRRVSLGHNHARRHGPFISSHGHARTEAGRAVYSTKKEVRSKGVCAGEAG